MDKLNGTMIWYHKFLKNYKNFRIGINNMHQSNIKLIHNRLELNVLQKGQLKFNFN
jgi:hypothetical protein